MKKSNIKKYQNSGGVSIVKPGFLATLGNVSPATPSMINEYDKSLNFLKDWYSKRSHVDAAAAKQGFDNLSGDRNLFKIDGGLRDTSLGAYYPTLDLIGINRKAQMLNEFGGDRNTITHELAHRSHSKYSGSYPYLNLENFPYTVNESTPITDNIISGLSGKLRYDDNKSRREYLQDPHEIHARMMEFRQAYNLNPNSKFTKEQFNKLKSKGIDKDFTKQLINAFKSEDDFIQAMNDIVSSENDNTTIGMAQNGGNPQNNTMKNNKTYRGINKYQGGGNAEYDPAQYMSGLDTQFTDFMSQNPEFSNLDTNLKILPEKEWRKQNGYPEFFWPWESSKKREAEARYNAYVQSQKQGQESLKIAKPMGKALFGLQKLNETADLERTFGQKRDAYSLDDEVPQMAYRGFFQQGGAIREEIEDTEEENNNEEMIDGIIEMLRQIEDMDNRKRVAIQKLQELQKEGIQVDAEDFLEDVMEEEYEEEQDMEDEEEQDVENMKNGGIPQRYKNLGFTRVGQKKNSTREGKKWMVLAKKGDKYKVVHGGAAGMSDYTKHKDKDRRDRFWKRHNAGAPGKSRDPFSPLYWHKKFGTWEQGGSVKLEGLNKYQNSGGVSSENDNTTIGMAQNGGMMGQGIMNQQMMGYKDNSPYKNLPFQDFFTNRLTMNGVSKPILAIPNRGRQKVMLPNSGIYEFPMANVIREIPLAQEGLSVKESKKKELELKRKQANAKQEEAIDYFNRWRESPRGEEMLRNSAGSEEEYERIRLARENELEQLPDVKFLKEQMYHPNKLPMSGVYTPPVFLPKSVESSWGISLYPHGLDSPTTMLHEVGHAEDRAGKFIPESDKELINSYRPKSFGESPRGLSEEGQSMSKRQKRGEAEFMRTYGSPKEVRELLHQLRFTEANMPDPIYDPFTEKVTPEIFEKMKNKVYEKVDKNPLKILQKNFTDEQLINLLNSISLTDSNQENFYALNGGRPKRKKINSINTGIPLAKNGFFSRLGKGIGKAARGVGNAFHDWGMMVADSAGNRLGLYDIDNERYKTRFGRGLAGVNDQLQSVTGKIGKAVASAAVPGMSGVFNMPGNIGAAMNQQPMQQPAFNQYQQPQGGNYNQMQMLMNFLPYLSNSFQGSPMFNQGGRINLTGMYNPYSQLPNDYYMQGGTVKSGLITDSDAHNKKKGPGVSYPKRGPMGPKGYNYSTGRREVQDYTTFNEYIPTENLIPIQTEKDELIVLPTGDITPVMATKRHSKMGLNDVTDVTPEGSYVLSAHGNVRIYKDEANSLITETGIKPYRLGYGQEKPTEKTLGDFMHKNKMTPAEIGAKVMKQFPIWKTNNIFESAANAQNKINRKPYLEGLIQLSELDRYRKGLVQPEQMRDGGLVMKRFFVPKAQLGAAAGAAADALGRMWESEQARKEREKYYRRAEATANESYGKQLGFLGMGAGMGIAGTLAQDPLVDWTQLDPSFIRQMEYRTPIGLRESMANRAYANRPDYMRFAPNFASGVGAEQAAYAQALKQGYDAEISLFDKDRAARNQYLTAIQGYQDKNEASRIDALNRMRMNRNQMIGNVGDRAQGLMDSSAIVEANRANSIIAAAMGQAASAQQAIRDRMAAWSGFGSTIGSAWDDYQRRKREQETNG